MTKVLCFSMMLMFVSAAGLTQSGATSDSDAIKAVIRSWAESFEKRDANLRNSLLTQDTVFFNAFGVERVGKQEVTTFWKELFATGTFDQAKVIVPKEKIRFLRPDLAIVDRFEDVTGQRGVESGKALPPRKVHLTFVMIKEGGRWLVSYYRAGDLRDPETAR
jgi:uncharacterized protein (TIGR02246 family)